MTIKILIADDHPLVRSGICNELIQCPEFEVVGEAQDGNETLQFVKQLQPDILLLDARMPGMRPIRVLEKIKEEGWGCRVLVLTAYSDTPTVLGMLRGGADGYLLKDEEPGTIEEAIHAVTKGETWLSPSISRQITNLIKDGNNEFIGEQLTARENEVAACIVDGFTNKQISEKLEISERTAEFHVSNMIRKLGVKSRVDIAVFATEWRLGDE
ncbi:MAG: response regulator transcription factor [Anaerolineales bacterium]|nr:response regulator transcription factor [Anaerolineales bacterium]